MASTMVSVCGARSGFRNHLQHSADMSRNQNLVQKWSTQSHASRIKADIRSYLWLGSSLINLHLSPGFEDVAHIPFAQVASSMDTRTSPVSSSRRSACCASPAPMEQNFKQRCVYIFLYVCNCVSMLEGGQFCWGWFTFKEKNTGKPPYPSFQDKPLPYKSTWNPNRGSAKRRFTKWWLFGLRADLQGSPFDVPFWSCCQRESIGSPSERS